MLIAYFTGLRKYFSFERIKNSYQTLEVFVKSHPVSAPLYFMVIYFVTTMLLFPTGAILSLIGGFLFPFPLSSLYVVISATLGACSLFFLTKTTLGQFLKEKALPFMSKLEKGFSKNEVSYLLFIRFTAFVPFWIANLAPAFLGIRFWTFCWTTLVGIMPGTLIYTHAGASLTSILETHKDFSLSSIFTLRVKIALALLGLLALSPIVIKKLMKPSKTKND